MFDRSAMFSDEAKLYSKNAIADFDSGLVRQDFRYQKLKGETDAGIQKKKWDGTKSSEEKLRFSRLFGDTEASAGIRNGKLSIPAYAL
jgi:hypothetical protein